MTYTRDLLENINMSIGDHIPENYNDFIMEFKTCFLVMNVNHNLTMTQKNHIVIHHYEYYFQQTGKNLKDTNGEYTETCHNTLRKSEEDSGLKIVRRLVQTSHNFGKHQANQKVTLDRGHRGKGRLAGLAGHLHWNNDKITGYKRL